MRDVKTAVWWTLFTSDRSIGAELSKVRLVNCRDVLELPYIADGTLGTGKRNRHFVKADRLVDPFCSTV